MADDQDKESKTEEASEKKIRDSIDKGQTPFSKETPILFSLLGTLFVASFFMTDRIAESAQQLAAMMEQSIGYTLDGSGDIYWLIQRVIFITAALTIPLFLVLIAAGIAGSAAQNAPRVVGDRIQPKLSRISLVKGWERIFSAKGMVEFLKSVAKLVFAAVLVAVVLHDLVPRMMEGMYSDLATFLSVVKNLIMKMFGAIIFAMVSDRCRRLDVDAPPVESRPQDDPPRGQGRGQATAGRPDHESAPALGCPGPRPPQNDERRAERIARDCQPDAPFNSLALSAGRRRGADRRRQGPRPYRAAYP
jgi:hypothetical protein